MEWDTIDVGVLNPLVNTTGGLPVGSTLLVYGSSGVGKTTIMLDIMQRLKKNNPDLVVGYIDADYNGVHPLRLKTVTESITGQTIAPMPGQTSMTALELFCVTLLKQYNVYFVRASTMRDLRKAFSVIMNHNPQVLFIDTMTQYFRVDMAIGGRKSFDLNKLYVDMVNYVIDMVRKHNVTTLMTAQRKSAIGKIQTNTASPSGKNDTFKRDFVGGEILGHFMDYIIDLERVGYDRYMAKVWKHRVKVAKKKQPYTIDDDGRLQPLGV